MMPLTLMIFGEAEAASSASLRSQINSRTDVTVIREPERGVGEAITMLSTFAAAKDSATAVLVGVEDDTLPDEGLALLAIMPGPEGKPTAILMRVMTAS